MDVRLVELAGVALGTAASPGRSSGTPGAANRAFKSMARAGGLLGLAAASGGLELPNL